MDLGQQMYYSLLPRVEGTAYVREDTFDGNLPHQGREEYMSRLQGLDCLTTRDEAATDADVLSLVEGEAYSLALPCTFPPIGRRIASKTA